MHSTDLTPGMRIADIAVRGFIIAVWIAAIAGFFWFVVLPRYRDWRGKRLIRQDIRLYKRFIQGLKEGFQNGPRNHW